MSIAVLLKALVVWIIILALAVLNGALRERALVPAVGTFVGLIASGIVLSVCVALVSYLAVPWYGPLAASQYWLIGILWLVLTLLFELGFGRFVRHQDWAQLLQAYTFKSGNIWPVVLAFVLLSPWLAARVRGML